MLLVSEIEERMHVLVGYKYYITAVASRAAVRTTRLTVEPVPVETVAALTAVAGLHVYLSFVYEHIRLRIRPAIDGASPPVLLFKGEAGRRDNILKGLLYNVDYALSSELNHDVGKRK